MPTSGADTRKASRRKTKPSGLQGALRRVRLLLCDVDGVLTDASVFIGGAEEIKRFNILDGLGLVAMREQGLKVGWVSSRPSTATARRARELKIHFLRQEKGSKVSVVERLLAENRYRWEEVCYVGDDIVDVGVMNRAGVAVAVSNAVPEALAAADYVTHTAGGHGAVREVVELILKAQGRWAAVVAGRAA